MVSERVEPTDADREAAYTAVRSAVAAIEVVRPGAVDTALFLLAEAKASCERVSEHSDNLESKATTLLGLVAGASGMLGVFGTSRDGKSIIATPIVLGAAALTVAAIVCLLYVLRAKRVPIPGLDIFISSAMVADDNRLGLALTITRLYAWMRNELAREIRSEPRALFYAYTATAAAAVLVLLNVAVTSHELAARTPARISATASSTTFLPAKDSQILPNLNRKTRTLMPRSKTPAP
jgi:hypothetical protein